MSVHRYVDSKWDRHFRDDQRCTRGRWDWILSTSDRTSTASFVTFNLIFNFFRWDWPKSAVALLQVFSSSPSQPKQSPPFYVSHSLFTNPHFPPSSSSSSSFFSSSVLPSFIFHSISCNLSLWKFQQIVPFIIFVKKKVKNRIPVEWFITQNFQCSSSATVLSGSPTFMSWFKWSMTRWDNYHKAFLSHPGSIWEIITEILENIT